MQRVLLLLIGLPHVAGAEEALIAVATNFLGTAAKLEAAFESTTDHAVTITGGATGKLYAQILHGAPYDAILAADAARPERLEAEGRGIAGSRFTYAAGRLVLWSSRTGMPGATLAASLGNPEVRAVAIANPRLAPYGAAAMEVIESLGFDVVLRDRIVIGENVGQAFALAATGNADLAFVALAQVGEREPAVGGAWLLVDSRLHSPIRQQALLLDNGRHNAAARAFLAFLAGPGARAIIRADGYDPG